MQASRDQRGQATVELAFSVLLLAFVFVLLLQVGLVARDQVLVAQAAREAARTAAVDPDPGAATAAALAATGLNPGRLDVRMGERQAGAMVSTEVTYRSRIVTPVGGRVLLEPKLSSKAAMRVESPGL